MTDGIWRAARTLACILALTALPGCGAMTPYPFLAVVGGETMSLSTTDKTLGDHLASAVTGEDCSTLEALEKRPYCQPRRPRIDPAESDPACYRTIGTVDCYDRNYKYATPSQRIGG